MPELPEVETVRRGLAPIMEDAMIVTVDQNRPDLRFPFDKDFTTILTDSRINKVSRRAKYLLFHLDNDYVLVAHLGMSGSFRIVQETATDRNQLGEFRYIRGKDEKHDHVVFHLEKKGTSARVMYNDPRRFGFMLLVKRDALDAHPFFKDLGPEPTGNGLDTSYLANKFMSKKAPLKSALLDQKIIAGLGNIYVCEALWRAQLSPQREAATLVTKTGKPTKELENLSMHIRQVVLDAIEAGGSSLQDHIQADGNLGYFQHSFSVYGREGESCKRLSCGGQIDRITQSGRSTFYCAKCQR